MNLGSCSSREQSASCDTRIVGLPNTIQWDIRDSSDEPFDVLPGDIDTVTVEIAGRTVERADMAIAWWEPNFSLQMLSEARFRPGVFREELEQRDEADRVAVDYTFDVDCATTEDSFRRCGDGSEIAAWVDEGRYQVVVTATHLEDGVRKALCSASVEVMVERNTTDHYLQPLDVALNHNPLRDLAEAHGRWHESRDALPVFPGDDWLLFHRVLVRNYEDFRKFFGYPPLDAWDGSVPIPNTERGYTLAEPTRPDPVTLDCEFPGSEGLPGCTPPPWLTVAGDGTPRPAGEDQCHDANGNLLAAGQTKLADFPDSVALGCVVNRTHHAAVHRAIPGAMHWVDESVYDPIFWRYHKWVSGVEVGGGEQLAAGVTASVDSVWGAWEAEKAKGPPGISAQFPPPNRTLSTLDGVLVVFWEDVSGVDAGDLTVNGSPATQVEQDGEWYLFTGYASPGDGATLAPGTSVPVTVELAAGGIADNVAMGFAGATWSYTITPDADGDGVPDDRDNCVNAANVDQRNNDVDLVHGYHGHAGHEPEFGDAGDSLGDACDDDDDNDGLSDGFEEEVGTDPFERGDPDGCPLDPRKHAPGVCGCGVSDRDGDGDGNPDCIPPLFSSTTTTTLPSKDCSQPVTSGAKPAASDCLFILRTAVGTAQCAPECVCALRGRYPITASDALACLRTAVGLSASLLCPCPGA